MISRDEQPTVQVEQLSKSFGAVQAVTDVSFKEKENRTAEVLLLSLSPVQLMLGKLLALGGLAGAGGGLNHGLNGLPDCTDGGVAVCGSAPFGSVKSFHPWQSVIQTREEGDPRLRH